MSENTSAAEWLRGIIGRYDDEAAGLNGSCSTMAKMFGVVCKEETCRTCMVKLMTAIADRIDAERTLPADMEWPRFEDGELVKMGDEVEYKGETMRVYLATFDAACWALWCSREGIDGRLSGSYGERVKRPAPKVLDADGVPIKVGDTVYLRSNGREGKVVGFYEDKGETWVGETWVSVSYELGSDRMTVNTEGKALTHERPDSWERLEEDAYKRVCEYAGAQKSIVDDDKYSCINCPYDEPGTHTDKGCQERMRLDLVRRAKKLAKAGEVE